MDCVYAGISESGIINEPHINDNMFSYSSGAENPPMEYKSKPKACFGSFRRNNVNGSTIAIGKYIMWDRIETPDCVPLYLGTCYFPVLSQLSWNDDLEDALFHELLNFIVEFSKSGLIVFGGDFNASIPLSSCSTPTSHYTESKKLTRGKRLLDIFKQFNLVVLNDMIPENSDSITWMQTRKGVLKTSILDYAICSNALLEHIASFDILDESFFSDHRMLKVSFNDLPTRCVPLRESRLQWRIDLIPSPPKDWSFVKASRTAFEQWLKTMKALVPFLRKHNHSEQCIADLLAASFHSTLDRVTAQLVPIKRIGLSPTPFMSSTTRQFRLILRKASSAYVRLLKYHKDKLTSELINLATTRMKFIKKSFSKHLKALRAKVYHKVFEDIEQNAGNSRVLASKISLLHLDNKHSKRPPNIIRDPRTGLVVSIQHEVADVWKYHYTKLLNPDKYKANESPFDEDFLAIEEQLLSQYSMAPHEDDQSDLDFEFNHDISDEDTFRAIRRLQNGKVSYDINPDILKFAADAFENSKLRGNNTVVKSITFLLNELYSHNTWPMLWRKGFIISIHKLDLNLIA